MTTPTNLTNEYIVFAQNHLPLMIMTAVSFLIWIISTIYHQRKSFLINSDQAMMFKKQGLGLLDIRVNPSIELIGVQTFDINKNRTGDFARFQKKGVVIIGDDVKDIQKTIAKFQENGYVATYGLRTSEWMAGELPIKNITN